MLNINNFYNTADIKRFYFPGKIFMGVDSRNILFQLLGSESKVILVCDIFFSNDPFTNEIIKKFPVDKLKFLIVGSEPDTRMVGEYISELKYFEYDVIIAIGGGSTIDTAKALLAYKIYNKYYKIGYGENRDLREISFGNKPVFAAMPTTAGTGSETSRYYLISDNETKEKTVSRSWSVVPEYVILDPYFLQNASKKLLALTAFDAFVHLWETFICKYERSEYGDMLSLTGMSKIIPGIHKIVNGLDIDLKLLMDLQFAACLGGIAIANVRTGLMHDAGEALSAQISLSHPETLVVFFREAFNLVKEAIEGTQNYLFEQATFVKYGIKSIDDLINFWTDVFDYLNITRDLKNKLKCNFVSNEKIVEKIYQDKVLIEKESPLKLSKEDLEYFVEKSIKYFI